MLPHRTLLYHRGIDDHVGTYASDYVLFVACSIFAVVLAWKSSRSRHIPDVVLKSTYSVVGLLTIMSLVALIGGLTHQFLQEVEPYETWHDNWTWLIVWRFGTSLAVGIIFALLVLGYSLLEQEDIIRWSRSAVIAFYVIITTLCVGLFAESWWRISHPEDPWSVRVTFMSMFASATIELICAIIVTCKSCKKTTNMYPERENTNTCLTKSSECPNNNEKKDPTTTSGVRIDLIFHTLAPLIFIIGGIIQYVLGHMGCADHDDAYSVGCPLPNNFNHNVVLHLLHVLAMTVYFSAEMLAIKRRIILNKYSADDVTTDSLIHKKHLANII